MTYRIHIKDGRTHLGDYGGEYAPASLEGEGAVEFTTLADAQHSARKLSSGDAENGEYEGMKCTAYPVEEPEPEPQTK